MYGVCAVLTLACFARYAHLELMRYDVPLGYATTWNDKWDDRDLLWECAVFQQLGEHGAYLTHRNLGAPGRADWSERPDADMVHVAVDYVVASVTPSFGTALNTAYIATYPLAALTALWVFRRFGAAWPPAMAMSMLYAFLPYHLLRRASHLRLSGYWVVPLMVAVLLWIAGGRRLLVCEKLRIRIERPLGVLALLFCIIVASGGIYYGAFGVLLLAAAAAIALSRDRSWRALFTPALLGSVMIATMWLNMLPSRVYLWTHGNNTEYLQRPPIGNEVYGLRITQLLLPVTGHRVPQLARIKEAYNHALGPPWVNENDGASLGVIGGAGFCFLIFNLLWRTTGLLGNSALLTISCVLLGTISGFLSVAAILTGGLLRGANRISVYIAFFGLLACADVLTNLYNRFITATPWARVGLYATSLIVFVLGILDQTTAENVPRHAQDQALFATVNTFVKQIEQSVPTPDAMIFQLPYMAFPEPGPVQAMWDYEPLRPTLHSRTLRWSYANIRGRASDLWYRRVSELPVDRMTRQLALAGFSGIYLDRDGYADHGADVESQLTRLLGPPIIRSDGRASYFTVSRVEHSLAETLPPDALQRAREEALEVLDLRNVEGCYPPERDDKHVWRWCDRDATLQIVNESKRTRRVQVSFVLSMPNPVPGRIDVALPDRRETIVTKGALVGVRTIVNVAPGGVEFRLSSNGEPIQLGAPRRMVIQMIDPQVAPIVE